MRVKVGREIGYQWLIKKVALRKMKSPRLEKNKTLRVVGATEQLRPSILRK